MNTGLSLFGSSLPFRPWIFFLLFLAAGAALSFGSFSVMAQLWIVTFGFLLPLGLGLSAAWTERRQPNTVFPAAAEGKEPLPLWLIGLGIAALLLSRFYRLTSLPFWLVTDEGTLSLSCLRQMDHWQDRLLWTNVPSEPFIVWSITAFFHGLTPSLFTFRLYPALVSILTVLAAYGAARAYFSRSTAFIFAGLMAFSFWALTLSRLCMCPTPFPLLQCLAWGALGYWLRAKDARAQRNWFMALLLIMAAGFYVWTNWLVVWLAVTLVLAALYARERRTQLSPLVFYLSASALALLPLVLARLGAGGMGHIHRIFNLSDPMPFLRYLHAAFWKSWYYCPYGSNWGGIINPVLASLALVGLLEMVRSASKFLLLGLLAALFFSLLPAVFTSDVELYRLVPFFFYWLVLAAWGVQSLRWHAAKAGQMLAVCFLMLSFGLDLYNFAVLYPDPSRVPLNHQWRSVSVCDAYRTLEELQQKDGPLDIFSKFNVDFEDTLDVAVYPFDRLQNPRLAASRPKWAVVIANIHYAPYFTRHFAGVQYRLLKSDRPSPPPLALFLIPAANIPAQTLEDWVDADRVYRGAKVEMNNTPLTEKWDTFIPFFSELQDKYPRDGFLTAVYWEKIAFCRFFDHRCGEAALAAEKAANLGFPSAHLFYAQSVYWNLDGDKAKAQKALRKSEQLAKGPVGFP